MEFCLSLGLTSTILRRIFEGVAAAPACSYNEFAMLVKITGAALYGIEAIPITLEVHAADGFRFFLVGLPDNAVKESERRIEAALHHSGFKRPGKKITVNMAPADIRKEGAAYDLPIALGMLAASGQIPAEPLKNCLIMGELSLDGSILPIRGALPMALLAAKLGLKTAILPHQNAEEAAVVHEIELRTARNLRQVCQELMGQQPASIQAGKSLFLESESYLGPDFSEVKGQQGVKRAMEVAAAGGHNLIMIGPPGGGKTMLAKRLPGILPPMTREEALEVSQIHSVAIGKGQNGLLLQRPFRNPHHTISEIALTGGGSQPKPGEISLAHHGVLFLDELPEFKRSALEVMRQPLEDRVVVIGRSKMTVAFPAGFMLVAAMNPCPCGHYNNPHKVCECPKPMIERYLGRISGPLMDRIDMQLEVVPVELKELMDAPVQENSQTVRERVVKARLFGMERRSNKKVYYNAQMSPAQVRQECQPDAGGKRILELAMTRLQLSARAYDRILKVARSIADLEHSEPIEQHHIAEAIQYRSLDKGSWGRR